MKSSSQFLFLFVQFLLLLAPFTNAQRQVRCSTSSSIVAAFSDVQPGDEIIIAPGRYFSPLMPSSFIDEAFMTSTVAGTESLPIILRGEDPANPPQIFGSDVSYWSVVRLHSGANYWRIQDLVLQSAQKGIIIDKSNHVEIRRVEVKNIGEEAIHVRDGSKHTLIEDCTITDTGRSTAGFGEGIYVGSDRSVFNFFDPAVAYTVIRNCKIGPNVRAEAFDVKEGTYETTIENCTIDATGISGQNFADSFIDIKGDRCYIRFNTFLRNGATVLDKGIAILDRGVTNSASQNVIHDNVFNFDGDQNIPMVSAGGGTDQTLVFDNTRIPAGGQEYSGGPYINECCPPWYELPDNTQNLVPVTTSPTPSPTAAVTPPPTPRSSSPPTPLPTPPPSLPPTPLPTSLPTPLPSPLPSPLPTPLPSPMPTPLPTSFPTPFPTGPPTDSPTFSPTDPPTPPPTVPPTVPPTQPPTSPPTSVSFQPTPPKTDSPTVQATSSPTTFPSFQETSTPTSLPTLQATFTPTTPPTARETSSPTSTPTSSPTTRPSFEETSTPTSLPTLQATFTPTTPPTARETSSPTSTPTSSPTTRPSFEETSTPTSLPTLQATFTPTTPPTARETSSPTSTPTSSPTTRPSFEETSTPTSLPTLQATFTPTTPPTARETSSPTSTPTSSPTTRPSFEETSTPTSLPTLQATFTPTTPPTARETSSPTSSPSVQTTSSPTSPPIASTDGPIATAPPTLPLVLQAPTVTPVTQQPTATSPVEAAPIGRPVFSPVEPASAYCDDSDFDTFLVPSLGVTQRCVWLASRPEFQDEVCGTSLGAEVCPELCGVCTDDCDDIEDSVRFVVDSKERNCLWLRMRPELKPIFCDPTSEFAINCPETCDICDAPRGMDRLSSPAPTPPPQVPGYNCDDDDSKLFPVGDGNQFQTCMWLASRPDSQAIFCRPDDISGAYNICEETCGKCVDNCVDTNGRFSVGDAIRDCKWLALRPQLVDVLCVDGEDPWVMCPETCNTCDGDGTVAPTPVPPPVTPTVGCDDSQTTKFLITEIMQYQSCIWLSSRPEWKEKLCTDGHSTNARAICPETCGECVDSCSDTNGKFNVGNAVRDCRWLYLRPNIQDELCGTDEVQLICPETCNACDSTS